MVTDETTQPIARQLPPKPASGFPIVAALHLLTVAGVLLGCVRIDRLRAVFQNGDGVSSQVAAVVFLLLVGGLLGGAIGLSTTRRRRGCLLGIASGGVSTVLAAAIVLSASPKSVLFAIPTMLVVPVLLRVTHR